MAHIVSLPTIHLPSLPSPRRLIATWQLWLTRSRERQELARFSDYDLQDIGMTHADRMYQLSKPLWRE